MGAILKLEGRRFGKLRVLHAEPSVDRKTQWLCVCDCGKERVVFGYRLNLGITDKCHACTVKLRIRHGDCGTVLHWCWSNMKQRCLNPANPEYKNYGGRGISICQEWLDDYLNFKRDMREGYVKGLSIERINNSKGYCKDNCRWATGKEQLRNTRRNRIVQTHLGDITAAEVAEIIGLSSSGIKWRLDKGLYSDDVFKPSRKATK